MTSIETLRDRYEGERAFVVGNGPSLQRTPLDRLSSEFTFAMNGINELYDETEWRPTFYFMGNVPARNANPRTEYVAQNVGLGITCIVNSEYRETFGDREGVYYVERRNLKLDPLSGGPGLHEADIEDVRRMDTETLERFWSDDIAEVVYNYHSMYEVLQIAVYMGFDELYLVGCDLGFDYYDPHMVFDDGLDPFLYEGGLRSYLARGRQDGTLFRSLVNGVSYRLFRLGSDLSDSFTRLPGVPGDQNHFVSDYWTTIRDLRYLNEEIPKAHEVARRMAAERGVEIFNATVGGELEVYPRVDIQGVLNGARVDSPLEG